MRTETVSVDVVPEGYAALHSLKDRMRDVAAAPLRLRSIEHVEQLTGRRQVRITLEIEEGRDARETVLASLRAEIDRSS